MFNKFNHKKINIILPLLLIYFLIGALIFDDYGLSWDEPYHRINGFVALNSIRNFLNLDIIPNLEHSNQWMAEQSKIYGSIFDLISSSLEKLFNFSDIKKSFLMKHFLNFFLFFIACCYFYRIVNLRYSVLVSVLGVIFLILSPRIFAHSFFNIKDSVFLSFFIIAIYYSIIFTKSYTYKNGIYAAISSALLMLVKITGIIVPSIILFFFIFKSIDNIKFFLNKLSVLFLFFVVLIFLTIIFWPLLWNNPIDNFIFALKTFTNFNWRGGIFFYNEYISSLNLPWNYSLIWIVVSNPIFYLINFIFGSILILFKISERFINLSNKNPNKDVWNNENERIDFIFFMIFYLTLFLVISLKAPIYTGWRHLFFLYPSLIFISLRSIDFFANKIDKRYVIIICLPFLMHIAIWMYKNHPYQNVYFNFLAGKKPNKNFELDYWGLSNKEAIEYLIQNKKGELKLFILSTSPYKQSLSMIDKKERHRIKFVKTIEDANYLLTNHYYQKENPIKYKVYLDNKYKLVKEIKVDNIAINSIYKK